MLILSSENHGLVSRHTFFHLFYESKVLIKKEEEKQGHALQGICPEERDFGSAY